MAVLTGTLQPDTLTGTSQVDQVSGLAGSDTILGRESADILSGGEGGDVIFGGAGGDLIYGFGASDRQAGTGDIAAARVGAGFGAPVYVTSAPGDPDRLYVVEKGGTIRILDPATGQANADPFLTIPPDQLKTQGVQGLMSLAFHPDYATNGKFYVLMNNSHGDVELREYQRSATNPDMADPASSDTILVQPTPNNTTHNGGWIGFGPDGYLYIPTGDGGPVGDPENNAQNPQSLLGKILRIDVNGDDFTHDTRRDYSIPGDNPFVGSAPADEIWAAGLRNPWRASFDSLTGDLYIGDVGQSTLEEINFQSADSHGGANYGWAIKEGTNVFDGTRPGNLPPDSPELVDPVFEYPHLPGASTGSAVIGGYVYRGPGEGMQGLYLFSDFGSNRIWSFRTVDGAAVDVVDRTVQFVTAGGQIDNIVSFGQDGRGNLFIVGIDGEIFRLTPGAGAGDGADSILGGDGNDTVHGGAQNDTIRGGADNDSLYGGGQDDVIDGGAGRDRMAGGAGADVFEFNATSESGSVTMGRDLITDFTPGEDVIDLETIDAQTSVLGNQAFTLIGSSPFTAEGQIRLVQGSGGVIVYVNTTGTDGAEMSFRLAHLQVADLQASDFIL